MRVVLDCRMAEWSGVGRYTQGLARALAERDDLSVVCAAPKKAAHKLPNGVEHVVAEASPLSLAGMRELSAVAKRVCPDVTHCLHFPTPLPAPHPLVVTLHDVTPLAVPGVMPSAVRRAAYRWFTARAVRLADAIITPSEFTARDVERFFPAAHGKMIVTLEGADDFASGPREALPDSLTRFTSVPYVFAMGSTRAHKDLPTLVAAFSAIALSHPELHLLLAGPEVPGYLEASGLPAELRERALFTGAVTDGQLRTLYAEAAVFAFPSRYEGFGLPPLESMSLGTPVVCTGEASLPEVVRDAAITFSAGDCRGLARALTNVLDDPDMRGRLVSAGFERARQLTWHAAADRTVDAYRRAMAGPK